ncbi:hypothetical protein P4530_19835 [Bacillus thuringiensis]|nr:hypothetical protein [Bacillus thuringiensis]
MKDERLAIIHEISYLEVKHCIECPLNTSKEDPSKKAERKKQEIINYQNKGHLIQ